MSDAGDALDAALRVTVDATPAQVIAAGGGRPAVARLIAGLDPAPRALPPKGSALWKNYRTNLKNLERYENSGRVPKASGRMTGTLRALAAQLSLQATRRRAAGFRQSCRAAVTATISDDTPSMKRTSSSRTRTMPAGGHPILMPDDAANAREDNGRWVDAYLAGNVQQAGELFMADFLHTYMRGEDVEVLDVEKITLTKGTP